VSQVVAADKHLRLHDNIIVITNFRTIRSIMSTACIGIIKNT